MRHSRRAFLAFGVVLATAVAARADDDAAAARALVDKAVRAHGGQAELEKLPGVTIKFKGTFHGMGQAIPFTGEIATLGRDQQRIEIVAEAGGQKFRIVNVLNRDKGWARAADNTKELDKEDLAEAQEQAYAGWVATLVPLKDKAFTLSTIGQVEIEKRPALGVKVSAKDRRDVDLYFDKETGLLVKTETRVKDDTGQEVVQETFLSDHKEVQGTQHAMKFTVKRDGKLYVEVEVSECQLAEKLEDSVFAKP
ncbi:MAG TPA: hypothetical protein VKE74_28980 [Gemmataceae bacterium]|nr:hypothetical protein [Gemmataceae bacterium]